jgi:hypothetical protein
MSPRVALAVCLIAIYATLGVVRPVANYLRDSGWMRISVAVCFVLAGAFMLWLIFRDPRRRSLRTALTLACTAAVYSAVIYPMDSPEEKIHFIEYGVVGLLAYESFRRYWVALLFVAAAGWIDEGIQALLPSRYYDLRDVAFNAAAGALALLARYALTYERGVGAGRHEGVAEDAAR